MASIARAVHDTNLGQHFRISNDDDAIFGSCEGDIETAGVVEEANALMLVGARA